MAPYIQISTHSRTVSSRSTHTASPWCRGPKHAPVQVGHQHHPRIEVHHVHMVIPTRQLPSCCSCGAGTTGVQVHQVYVCIRADMQQVLLDHLGLGQVPTRQAEGDTLLRLLQQPPGKCLPHSTAHRQTEHIGLLSV